MKQGKNKGYLEKKGTTKMLWFLLYVICGLTVVTEFFMEREPHFRFDSFFGFYSLLGFIACAALILIAKVIGFALKKEEDYYD